MKMLTESDDEAAPIEGTVLEADALPPQSLPFASSQFWTSTESLTNLCMGGLFLLLVLIHRICRWLLNRRKLKDQLLFNTATEAETTEAETTGAETGAATGAATGALTGAATGALTGAATGPATGAATGAATRAATEAEILGANSPRFMNFQRKFVLVYTIAYSVDILGAPYIYSMYSVFHRLSDLEIRKLMRLSFIASAVSALVLPSFIDGLGRRLGACVCLVTYAARYLLAAFTSRFAATQIFYGIGVSLLYTVFDAWMVNQHRILGFPDSLLQDTFSTAVTTTSIVSVFVTEAAAVTRPYIGFPGIFCFASLLAVVGLIFASILWDENSSVLFPDSSSSSSVGATGLMLFINTFISTVVQILSSFQIFAVGVAYALMGCCLWILASFWTPLVSPPLQPDALFPSLMIACAAGAYLANVVSASVDVSSSSSNSSGGETGCRNKEKQLATAGAAAVAMRRDEEDFSAGGATGEETRTLLLFSGPGPAEGCAKDSEAVAAAVDGGGSSGEWNKAIEVTPLTSKGKSEKDRKPSIWYSMKTGMMLATVNGIPLRLMVIVVELLVSVSSFICSLPVSLVNTLICLLIIEVCFGIICSSFANLRAQIVPDEGRVITYNFFGFISSLVNVMLIAPERNSSISSLFLVSSHYAAISLCISLAAWFLLLHKSHSQHSTATLYISTSENEDDLPRTSRRSAAQTAVLTYFEDKQESGV